MSIHTTLAGGDLWITLSRGLFVYFNPHHPRGWRHLGLMDYPARGAISIHTTLAGGDRSLEVATPFCGDFNPHHPRGWRHRIRAMSDEELEFQSTPPSRVATQPKRVSVARKLYFNPHHPRGWRQRTIDQIKLRQLFQSTPPSRVATCRMGMA